MGTFTELAETAARQHGLLTAAQLSQAGYSKAMVSSRVHEGLFERRAKGVIQIGGTERTWEQDLHAALLATGGAASHRAASRLWGFRTVDPEVEIAIRYPRTAVLEGVVVHRSRDLEPSDVTSVEGMAVTTPERTICDLGLVFPEHEVHRILRHAVAIGLVTPHELWRMRQRTSKQGRNGTGVLERVLSMLPVEAEHTQSGLEVQFLEICGRQGITPPVIQAPVRVGGRFFRLDFAWVAQRVFVEIDGAAYHSTQTQIAADGGRQNLLLGAGWIPLRFTATDLSERPEHCGKAVRRALESVQKKDGSANQILHKSSAA